MVDMKNLSDTEKIYIYMLVYYIFSVIVYFKTYKGNFSEIGLVFK